MQQEVIWDQNMKLVINVIIISQVRLYVAIKLSDFSQGGELFNLLDRFAPLDESDSAFYMAEVLVAIEYLHSQGIIYRDLKPENIMLSRDGHVKLVSFKLSDVRDAQLKLHGELNVFVND
jgi:serine/threonine protein kinase